MFFIEALKREASSDPNGFRLPAYSAISVAALSCGTSCVKQSFYQLFCPGAFDPSSTAISALLPEMRPVRHVIFSLLCRNVFIVTFLKKSDDMMRFGSRVSVIAGSFHSCPLQTRKKVGSCSASPLTGIYINDSFSAVNTISLWTAMFPATNTQLGKGVRLKRRDRYAIILCNRNCLIYSAE